MSRGYHFSTSRRFERDHERIRAGLAVHPVARPLPSPTTPGFTVPPAVPLTGIIPPRQQPVKAP